MYQVNGDLVQNNYLGLPSSAHEVPPEAVA